MSAVQNAKTVFKQAKATRAEAQSAITDVHSAFHAAEVVHANITKPSRSSAPANSGIMTPALF